MKKKILIFGGHGTGSVIANAIIHAQKNASTEYEFAGFINDQSRISDIDGYPIIGRFSDAKKLTRKGYYFIYTVYKIGYQKERIELFESFNIPEDQIMTFIHPNSYISPDSNLEPGCVVMPGVTISSNSSIGRGTLIMSNASIGHDDIIGKHCFFTANSCTGSYVKFGDGVWIGLNATIRGRLNIGYYSAIGIGSVVTKNIGNNELWIGNPARFHKSVFDEFKY